RSVAPRGRFLLSHGRRGRLGHGGRLGLFLGRFPLGRLGRRLVVAVGGLLDFDLGRAAPGDGGGREGALAARRHDRRRRPGTGTHGRGNQRAFCRRGRGGGL